MVKTVRAYEVVAEVAESYFGLPGGVLTSVSHVVHFVLVLVWR